VPQTGELAFVGFWSSVVRVDQDKALQTKHNLNAEKIAKIRASDSLCGMILSDTIESSDKHDAQTVSMVKDFETIEKEDPVARNKKFTRICRIIRTQKGISIQGSEFIFYFQFA
jgi:hypothetical protein